MAKLAHLRIHGSLACKETSLVTQHLASPPPKKARSNIRFSREHLLRIRELAQEFVYLSYTSLDPDLQPRPSAAALVRAIAGGELELKRVRPPATPPGGRSA